MQPRFTDNFGKPLGSYGGDVSNPAGGIADSFVGSLNRGGRAEFSNDEDSALKAKAYADMWTSGSDLLSDAYSGQNNLAGNMAKFELGTQQDDFWSAKNAEFTDRSLDLQERQVKNQEKAARQKASGGIFGKALGLGSIAASFIPGGSAISGAIGAASKLFG